MLTSIYYCFYIKIYYKIHCSSTLDSFEEAKSEESPVPLIEDLLINEEYINADEHDFKNTLFFITMEAAIISRLDREKFLCGQL